MSYWMLSSDSHVVEPPTIWDRVPDEFRDAAPYVEQAEDADWWCFEGRRLYSFAGASKAGLRFEGQEQLKREYRFADVREGAVDPNAFVRENEDDGIWGAVLYPSYTMNVSGAQNSHALTAMYRVYNDWLTEWCEPQRNRLKGIGLLNVDRVDEACAELRRLNGLGLAGAMIPVSPAPGQGYDRAEYDSLWALAEELGIPISLHIGTNRDQAEKATISTQYGLQSVDRFVRDSLARMIFGGVFERFPGLQVVSVEHELGWVPHFVERLDYTYTQREPREGWIRFRDDRLPSDFFRSHVYLSFQEDEVGLRNLDLIGADRLIWGSDYPHTESTFPKSREILDAMLGEVDADDRRMIVRDTTKRLYNFDVPDTEPAELIGAV